MYLSLNHLSTIALYSISVCSLVVILHYSNEISNYMTQSNPLKKHIRFFNPSILNLKVWAISIDYDGTFDHGHKEILEWINQFKDTFMGHCHDW